MKDGHLIAGSFAMMGILSYFMSKILFMEIYSNLVIGVVLATFYADVLEDKIKDANSEVSE